MPKYDHLHKIDTKGKYQPFPGFTVVASMHERHAQLCNTIYTTLAECPFLSDYYTQLPADSYHMTAFGVATQRYNGGSDWNSYIEGKLPYFQDLDYQFQESPLYPKITISEVSVSGSIHLLVDIPAAQARNIHAVAEIFECTHELPLAFHITLAYQYKRMSTTIQEEMQDHIDIALKQVLTTDSQRTLSPLKLCYFNDMTCFIPWNGHANPFIRNTQHSPHFFTPEGDALTNADKKTEKLEQVFRK